MKKIKLLIVLGLFPIISFTQGVEIVPFVGYMFGGSINFVEGKINITDGVDYGVSLLIPVQRYIDVEINYTRMDGTLRFEPHDDYTVPPRNLKAEETNLITSYFQLGVVGAFSRNNPNIIPFGSFSLGATLFSIDNYSDTWRFSITAGLGAKFMFSEHVGVMLRGRLMLPMAFSGVGGFCGVGTRASDCGLTLSGWTTIIQGDFSVGLIIKFGY